MLFSILMIDKPDSEELRSVCAPAHGEYIGNHVEGLRIGGPLLAEDGETITGSLIIKEFADKSTVEAFIAAEPYNQAGLFEIVIVRAIRVAVENSAFIPKAEAD